MRRNEEERTINDDGEAIENDDAPLVELKRRRKGEDAEQAKVLDDRDVPRDRNEASD
jgi:hypothetical protein